MYLPRPRRSKRPGKFDPKDNHVKHTRIGVWDLYEEIRTDVTPIIPGSSGLETYAQIVQCMPYVVRMLKDVLSIKRCRTLFAAFFVVEVSSSLLPAVSLWYAHRVVFIFLYLYNFFPQVFRTTPPHRNLFFSFHLHFVLISLLG